jgi:hypothetical protein
LSKCLNPCIDKIMNLKYHLLMHFCNQERK